MTNHTPEPDMNEKRVVVVVLDGAGVGALPDADKYGDQGSNTLGNVWSKHGPLKLPNLFALGLGHLINAGSAANQEHSPFDLAYDGRMAPLSPGKDTTSGHWELAGVVMDNPFPLYPDGFPDYIIAAFQKAIGRGTLGNFAASGTVIIEELCEEHLKTGFPIVYTSADSVFQIATHVDIVDPDKLYEWCETARKILTGRDAVGRVIARPFEGKVGSFKRTAGRHDYSLSPPGETILDLAKKAGYQVAVIGKVADVFAHRGLTTHLPGGNNEAIASDLHQLIDEVKSGLIWATFGDFDTVYGHRNDSKGFALALERFDLELASILTKLGKGDLLFITADHGCDPTFHTTDHTREYIPLLAWGPRLPRNINIGTRQTYADLAACASQWLKIAPPSHGSSFLK